VTDVTQGLRGIGDLSAPIPGLPTVPTTVCIPTHPARGATDFPGTLLGRAVASVRAQTMQPAGGVSIACDLNGDGAATTRQRALDAVETEWVSYLDSDDTFYPHHLETHWRILQESGADVAYSWFDGNTPFPESTHRGRQLDPAAPHHTTMTLTVRTALAKQVGFVTRPLHLEWAGEDWAHLLGLIEAGAKFIGTGELTWTYQVHGANTSGLPNRGDGPLT
jgi:hypothetical protein